ncbi:MAG TPA: ROK family protein [Bryobacteraceae bacterium]|nr:ROK family protein [Bryobacteraceae bacterium]
MNTLAIDIGGTKLAVGLFTGPLSGNVTGDDALSDKLIAREIRMTDRTGGPNWMLGQIAEIAKAWMREREIDACGVGFGGPVDFARQRIALSTHVEGWRDFPLQQHLHRMLGVPVVMDNDANAGALGEAVYGAGCEPGCGTSGAARQGTRPLFYMTLSTGIGGGIVLEGDPILRGADSYAGEIGHLTIRPEGPECLCGARGCFERMCSGLWLERDYGRPPVTLFGDPAFVERYVEDLALGLKAAIMLLNPARIVIGGGISKAGDRLFVPLRAALKRHITDWSRARIDVVPAALGDDSVLWGALALAAAGGKGKLDKDYP